MNPKLVRDRIPNLIRSEGKLPVVHYSDDDEYADCLREKLSEEVDEYLSSEKEEELADILEVIDAICDYKHIDKHSLQELKERKAQEKGSFIKRVVLDNIEEPAQKL
ncbi:nucleoside triphosphate pyrophosphohydrolase [Candidatus Pacearchaeota archaeon]|nr:nucleoside triphosphate pyrophosphohydrolase [Candidatus Pacearchaeota archaeon]